MLLVTLTWGWAKKQNEFVSRMSKWEMQKNLVDVKMQKQFGGRAFWQKWISGHGAQVSEIVCSPDENAKSMEEEVFALGVAKSICSVCFAKDITDTNTWLCTSAIT